jgi:glycosyltransferase involved in cell wall biosynthesis
MPPPHISAVITCLNEEGTIERFVEQLAGALERTGQTFEIVLVDDGSRDQTFAAIRRAFERDARISAALDLMKNSGQAAAITAGLAEARGAYVLMMDSDFQLSPDDVGKLIAAAGAGADFVNGYRVDRQDALGRKLPSWLANLVMRRVAGAALRDFGCTYRLVNRRLMDAFRLGPEKVLSIPLLVSRAGRIAEVPVSHSSRAKGRSGWTFRKLWRYNADNVVVLAEPVFQFVGIAALLGAALLTLRVVLDPWLHWSVLGAVTNGLVLNAVTAAGLFLTGLVCVVGEFVVRLHRGALGRPAYVVRERLARP